MFVTVDTHQRFKSFISQTTSIRLELSSSHTEKSCVSTVISKVLTTSSKLLVTMFSAW